MGGLASVCGTRASAIAALALCLVWLLQEGRLALTPVHDRYLLCCYTDNTAEIGSVKMKARAGQHHHQQQALAERTPVVCYCRQLQPASRPSVRSPHRLLQLEAARRDLYEPLARVGAADADAADAGTATAAAAPAAAAAAPAAGAAGGAAAGGSR